MHLFPQRTRATKDLPIVAIRKFVTLATFVEHRVLLERKGEKAVQIQRDDRFGPERDRTTRATISPERSVPGNENRA
jgi:hypothetical protein